MAKYATKETRYRCNRCGIVCAEREMLARDVHNNGQILLKCPNCRSPLRERRNDGKTFSVRWYSEKY